MKKIYTIACAAMALLAMSCTKDLGNYDFKPNEVISLEGVNNSYIAISGTETITIDPTISSTEGDTNFDCFWGIYESNVGAKMDTLSKTKTLDFLVKQRPNDWTLLFCAKNTKTGFAQYFKIPLKVTTPSAGGWYVLKDDGSQSDIDLFKTPTTISPSSKVENMFSYYNGKKIDGKASFLGYSFEYKSNEYGINQNTKTLFAGTDKDLSAVSVYSFKEIRNLGGMFYETPTVKSPGFLMNVGADYYLQNDGQIHGLYSAVANTGVFSSRKLADNANTPYKMAKYCSGGFFFDDLSSSFFQGNSTATLLTPVVDVTPKTATAMSANKNNKKLLFMEGSYAYFQDKTNPDLKILSTLTLSPTAFKMVNDTVKTTHKIFNASNYTISDDNMVYFANGNEVWSRSLGASKQELPQFTPPAGEVITFVKFRKFTGFGVDAPYAHNYLVIGTKIGEFYKVRMYNRQGGNLTTLAFSLDGKGSVGDVYFLR